VPLAVAGPNKCIAGFKSSGPKAGQVVFLPAPYAPEYDAKLKECIERWYALHSDDSAAPSGLQDLSKGLSSLLSDDEPVAAARVEEPPVVAKVEAKPEPAPAPKPEPKAEAPEAKKAKPPETKPAAVEEKPKFFDQPAAAAKAEPSDNGSQPDALIKKMQQGISKPNVPDWCARFSFEELDGLRNSLDEVNEEIRLAQIKARELEDRIERMEDLKNALLSAEGDHLTEAVSRVFERLGWTVKPALRSSDEVWLVDDDKTQAIVRLIYSTSQPNRAELAALAESVITYWGAHEVEPKGILVASTWADKSPVERPAEDFPESMNDFAKRKNLCLLTTSQLLSIYRDLDVAQADPRAIRENILTTSGCVTDYVFQTKPAGTTALKR
jgi:hypothetical protein